MGISRQGWPFWKGHGDERRAGAAEALRTEEAQERGAATRSEGRSRAAAPGPRGLRRVRNQGEGRATSTGRRDVAHRPRVRPREECLGGYRARYRRGGPAAARW